MECSDRTEGKKMKLEQRCSSFFILASRVVGSSRVSTSALIAVFPMVYKFVVSGPKVDRVFFNLVEFIELSPSDVLECKVVGIA